MQIMFIEENVLIVGLVWTTRAFHNDHSACHPGQLQLRVAPPVLLGVSRLLRLPFPHHLQVPSNSSHACNFTTCRHPSDLPGHQGPRSRHKAAEAAEW